MKKFMIGLILGALVVTLASTHIQSTPQKYLGDVIYTRREKVGECYMVLTLMGPVVTLGRQPPRVQMVVWEFSKGNLTVSDFRALMVTLGVTEARQINCLINKFAPKA